MRLSIFIGLFYIAWAINPEGIDSCAKNALDVLIVGLVFWTALIADIIDLIKKYRKL